MDQLRIGVVGLGVISKFYIAAFDQLPGVKLTAVCDLREEALEPFAGRVACYRDHRELLERSDVDAIVVNVPNDVHATVCGDAIAAGKSVCVEKPLATRVVDGRRLVAEAREAGVTLFTAFHRRYNDNAIKLLDGLPAPIASLRVRYLERIEEHVGQDQWYLDMARCGGGCVADNGPNAFDSVRQFIGDVTVTGATVTLDDQGVDRQAAVSLRSAAGVDATVVLDWAYPDGELKDIEVRLTDGTVHYVDMLDGHTEFKGSLWHEYAGILAHFEQLVRAGEDAAHGGLAALELVEDSYRAAGVSHE